MYISKLNIFREITSDKPTWKRQNEKNFVKSIFSRFIHITHTLKKRESLYHLKNNSRKKTQKSIWILNELISRFFLQASHTLTVRKLRNFGLTNFWQKFSESNSSTKKFYSELIWRNFFQVWLFFVKVQQKICF